MTGLDVLWFRPIYPTNAQKIIDAINAGDASSLVPSLADRKTLALYEYPATAGKVPLAYVAQTCELYGLVYGNATAPNGTTIVAPWDGPQNPGFPANPKASTSTARWVLFATGFTSNPSAPIYQLGGGAYIDEAAGDNQASGAAATPLATWSELLRRWRAAGTPAAAPTVHVSAAGLTNAADPLVFDETCPEGLVVVGTMTLLNGIPTDVALTTVNPINHAANTPLEISAGAAVLSFAPILGKAVVVTAAADPTIVGAKAYLMVDHSGEGFGACFVTPFRDATGAVVGPPAPGDTVSFYDDAPLSENLLITSGQITLRNFRVTAELAPSAVRGARGPSANVKLIGCSAWHGAILHVADGATLEADGCCVDEGGQLECFDATATINGCGARGVAKGIGRIYAHGAGVLTIDQDCLVTNYGLIDAERGGQANLVSVCLYGNTLTSPVYFEDGGRGVWEVPIIYGLSNSQTLILFGFDTRVSYGTFANATATTAGAQIGTTTFGTTTFAAVDAAGGWSDVVVNIGTGALDVGPTQSIIWARP